MKQLLPRRVDARTLRLALTYLFIIMAMSIGFSAALYTASADQTRIKIQPSSGTDAASGTAFIGMVGPESTTGSKIINGKHISQTDIDVLNRQLQQASSKIRSNELVRLIKLNIATLLLGSVLSYFLARRTLRPIENALEEQGRFASDASHELRTPLTTMQAENEEALRLAKLPVQVRSLVTSNLEEITRLRELTEGLLELSHNDTPLDLQAIWIDEAGTEAINRVIKQAQVKKIAINDELLHLQAIGNSRSLIQIIVILLDNAIKYSDAGTTIHLTCDHVNNRILLHVRDEGIGIDKKQLSRVFDRFYRVDQSRSKHQADGHGLGLSIALKLAHQQKAGLGVESALGKGSTFTLKLRVAH